MANTIFTTQNNVSGTTTLRAFGSAVSGGLEDVLTLSNRVVAIDWTSITWPSPFVPNTVIGYEVWKLDDPSATACPVYMKFNYVTNVASGYSMLITLNVGTGWSGSALTGVGISGNGAHNSGAITLNYQRWNSGSADSSLTNSWMSSDGDGFTWLHSVDTASSYNANSRFLLVVDRQRNVNGAAQANVGWPNTGFSVVRWYDVAAGVTGYNIDPVQNLTNTVEPYGESVPFTKLPIISTSASSAIGSDGQKTLVSPMWLVNRQGSYTSKMLVSIPANDANAGNVFDVNFLGASRKYKASSQYTKYINYIPSIGASAAIWWEDN